MSTPSSPRTSTHYKIDKHRHKKERFVGKTAVLSLGYGSSWLVFQNMCRIKDGVSLTDAEATSIVMIYRQRFKQIVANWQRANDEVLPKLGQHLVGRLRRISVASAVHLQACAVASQR